MPPAPVRRSTRSFGAFRGLLFLALPILLIGTLAFVTRDRVVHITEPPSTPTPTSPPGGFTTFQQPPRPSWLPQASWEELTPATSFPEALTKHPLHAAEYPVADCPDPFPFKTPEEYRRYAETLAECLLQAWRPHFDAMGIPLKPVQVISYDTEITTDCGPHDPRFPAFYCSGNLTFYLSTKSFELASRVPSAGARTTIHEVFHHIQFQSGIGQASRKLGLDDLEWSRRIELQTICSESRQSLTMHIGFTVKDYERVVYNLERNGEEVHGSNESLTYWGKRGFHATTLQDCNTWLVPADMVD